MSLQHPKPKINKVQQILTEDIIMKKYVLLFTIFQLFISVIQAQNNIMYIMKDGTVINQYNVNTDIDSIIFYDPSQTTESKTFTDTRDENVYKTVSIGTQEWMAENLRYLPEVSSPEAISSSSPFYYVYGFEGTGTKAAKATDNYQTYGVLYNWPAAINACPAGWHLPTDEDWQTLTSHLGGASYCSGKLRTVGTLESGTGLWTSPNTDASNESGFSALPGGHIYIYRKDGSYVHIGKHGYWWSATELNPDEVWYRRIDYNNKKIYNNLSPKEWGYSVRCVKD